MSTTHKGWIALDIDGTITDQAHHIPKEVVRYLTEVSANGWQIIFITGRTLSYGMSALSVFEMPYLLAIQNGADILSMPEKRRIVRSYLPSTIVKTLDEIYRGEEEDFVIYAGYERGDFCYYRPHKFSKPIADFLEKVKPLCPEPWQAVSRFDFPEEMAFPLIKGAGYFPLMEKIYKKVAPLEGVCVSMIREPHAEGIYLNLITAPQATKGAALEAAIKTVNKRGVVIAAGDDFNDVSMLKVADIPIVIETAPKEVQAYGKIIARSPANFGIIEALSQAIKMKEDVF